MLGLLIDAAHPLTVADVEARLAAHGLVPFTWGTRTVRKLLADLLAHQRRIGRVRRVERGVYAIVPTAISPSLRYRCGRVLRDATSAMSSADDHGAAAPQEGLIASHHSDIASGSEGVELPTDCRSARWTEADPSSRV